MVFQTSKLKKRLRDRKRSIIEQIQRAEKAGFEFTNESKVLRLSHIELIKEILKWISELENIKTDKKRELNNTKA